METNSEVWSDTNGIQRFIIAFRRTHWCLTSKIPSEPRCDILQHVTFFYVEDHPLSTPSPTYSIYSRLYYKSTVRECSWQGTRQINSMEQRCSWETTSCSGTQEVFRILCNLTVPYRFHNSHHWAIWNQSMTSHPVSLLILCRIKLSESNALKFNTPACNVSTSQTHFSKSLRLREILRETINVF
jgi:hypothetical protein